MGKDENHKEAIGSDGSTIVSGRARTLYLQCGEPEENAIDGLTQRFYTTLDEWREANPAPTVEVRLGPVIET